MSGAEAGHHASTQPGTIAGAPGAIAAAAAPVADERTLFGWSVGDADPQTLADALEKAFDYRGDVTLALRDQKTVTGYIFDRRLGKSPQDSTVRLLTATSDTPVSVRYNEIARLEFSGKDAAHGKSFETWIKKYTEKKLKGEKASIESEVI
jgi:hypothetical protein